MEELTLTLADLVDGKAQKFTIGDTDVCVARVGDEVFAINDVCTHAEVSLSEGELNGRNIECWLHGSEFDMATGEALTPPAIENAQTYNVIRNGDSVTITVEGNHVNAHH